MKSPQICLVLSPVKSDYGPSHQPSERPGHFRHLRKEADVVWVRELLLGMADGVK